MLASTIQAYYFNNSSEIRHDSIQGGVHPWSFCSYLKQRLLSQTTGCFQMHFVSVVLNKKIAAGRSDLRWTSRSTLSQFSSSFSGTPTTFSDPSFTFSLPSRFGFWNTDHVLWINWCPLQIHNSFKREALGQRIRVSEQMLGPLLVFLRRNLTRILYWLWAVKEKQPFLHQRRIFICSLETSWIK